MREKDVLRQTAFTVGLPRTSFHRQHPMSAGMPKFTCRGSLCRSIYMHGRGNYILRPESRNQGRLSLRGVPNGMVILFGYIESRDARYDVEMLAITLHIARGAC